jgi:hypothetical protein
MNKYWKKLCTPEQNANQNWCIKDFSWWSISTLYHLVFREIPIMPDKNCVEKVRASRANFYFSVVAVAIIALIIFLNS